MAIRKTRAPARIDPPGTLPTSSIFYRQLEWERSGKMAKAIRQVVNEMNRQACKPEAAVARLKKKNRITADEKELFDFAAINIGMAMFARGLAPGTRLKITRKRRR